MTKPILLALVAVAAVAFVAVTQCGDDGDGHPPVTATSNDLDRPRDAPLATELALDAGGAPQSQGDRAEVSPAAALSDEVWLVATLDPAVIPVSLPSAELVDGQGGAKLTFGAGRSSLTSLEPGFYRVVPRAEGWEPEPTTIAWEPGFAGELGVHLAPTSVYSGWVFDAATHEPIEEFDARVSYQATRDVASHNRPVPRTRFPGGEFRLGGIPATRGRVRIEVEAEEYLPSSTPWLELAPGTVYADLVLELEPDDGPQPVLSGRVTSAASGSAGIPHVVVSVFTVHAGEIAGVVGFGEESVPLTKGGSSLGEHPIRVRTSADGTYSTELQAQATYQVVVSVEGFTPFVSDPFDVLPGERLQRDIVLAPGATLTGRVLFGEDGEAASGLALDVRGPQMVRVELDHEHRFRASGLPDGDYTARVVEAGGRLLQVEPFSIAGGVDTELTIHCGSSRAGSSIEGTVELPPDTEDFHFLVAATAERSFTGAAAATNLDEDGRFQLHGFAAGEVFVVLSGRPAGVQTPSPPVRVVSWAIVEVDGQSPGRVRFDVAQTSTRIVVAPDEQPQGDARERGFITIASGDPRAREVLSDLGVVTLAPGREYVIHGLPVGEYLLGGTGVQAIEFTARGDTRVDVTLD